MQFKGWFTSFKEWFCEKVMTSYYLTCGRNCHEQTRSGNKEFNIGLTEELAAGHNKLRTKVDGCHRNFNLKMSLQYMHILFNNSLHDSDF